MITLECKEIQEETNATCTAGCSNACRSDCCTRVCTRNAERDSSDLESWEEYLELDSRWCNTQCSTQAINSKIIIEVY